VRRGAENGNRRQEWQAVAGGNPGRCAAVSSIGGGAAGAERGRQQERTQAGRQRQVRNPAQAGASQVTQHVTGRFMLQKATSQNGGNGTVPGAEAPAYESRLADNGE